MLLKDLIPWGRRSNESNVPVHVENRLSRDPFMRMHEEVDRLFESLLPGFFGRDSHLTPFQSGFTPDISVEETRKDVLVRAEIPGVDENDLDVRLEDGVLTVRGEKREEHTREEGGSHYCERRYGSFQRSVRVAKEIDTEHVEASFKNGVLTVKLPKQKESEPGGQKIKVNAA